jgi:site-specific DNA-methyltransferase (adenine-specific)
MEIINRKVNDLIPYDNNPRKNDEAVKYVKASIEQFGFKVPIVIDADGVIVAGHTRVKAAKELGMEEVPCIVADDLTPEQIKAYRLADNMTASKSEWDIELLNTELLDLEANFDMADFGFEIYPPTGILPEAIDLQSDGDDVNVKQYHCPKCGFVFEVTQ